MIEQLPLEIIEADKDLTMEAARLKAEHSVAYADCFTVGYSERCESCHR